MAVTHAEPGEVIDVRPFGAQLAGARTRTLFKTEQMEMLRMVMHAGRVTAEHRVSGEIVLYCLEGKVRVMAMDTTKDLEAGQMLYLGAGQRHSVQCVEDASLLLTILF